MTNFEAKGIELQVQSSSVYEADRRFHYSCEICCNRGCHISCDRCGIAAAHNTAVEVLKGLELDQRQRAKAERPIIVVIRG